MRSRRQRSPALRKRFDRPAVRRIAGVLSSSLIILAGCGAGTSGTGRILNLFGGASPTPASTATPIPTPTPTSAATPIAEGTAGHAGKRTARQARAASENAATASKEAAKASAAAALASKQAASVANQIGGSGPSNADVSLESGSGAPAYTPGAPVGSRETPSSSPSAAASGATVEAVARTTPTLSSSALESSGPPSEGNPAKAAKLIQDIDKIEKRVDRKNLSADDSQRDILAQKLLQEAKKALAEHDGVAAISLATKASTLFAPLPKLAATAIPSTP